MLTGISLIKHWKVEFMQCESYYANCILYGFPAILPYSSYECLIVCLILLTKVENGLVLSELFHITLD